MPDEVLPVESAPAPIASTERILAMDVLRGIAVFGIFLINMPLFLSPPEAFFNWRDNTLWSGAADRLVALFLAIFAQGKFYTLFSFLFGLGFGLQMLRSPNFLAVYRRRLKILLLIGIVHFTLLWWGDVLHAYALLGFVLLLFRDLNDRALLAWALALTLIPLAMALAGTTVERLVETGDKKPAAERREESRKKMAEDLRIYSKGSFAEILVFRLKNNLRHLKIEIFWSVELLVSFVVGLWVSRRRIMQSPQDYAGLLTAMAYLALPAGLLLSAADSLYSYLHPNQPSPLWKSYLSLVKEFLLRPAVAYGYAAVLLLIGIRRWMRPVAAVGRMALTNYLLHSLVFTTIANGYGFGLYGQIPPTTQIVWCAGFYALQIAFSVWWLRSHAYGPAEWAWRGLTYGVRPPWKIA